MFSCVSSWACPRAGYYAKPGDYSPQTEHLPVFFHEKFGRGEVLNVVSVGEPAVVAFFPGWGEKKVLARFLKLG